MVISVICNARMHLMATVAASDFDPDYEMAFVYCYDAEKKYCFSLSRFPGQAEIEVIVGDQQNHKRMDLCVQLQGRRMSVLLDDPANWSLETEPAYIIDLRLRDDEQDALHAALRKIFEGKNGLRIGMTEDGWIFRPAHADNKR